MEVEDKMAELKISTRAHTVYKNAIICDLTLPWGNWEENKDITLPRYRDSGFGFVSLTVGLDRTGFEETLQWVAKERARLRSFADWVHFVETAADIREARKLGKLAVGFHFQGTNPLGGDINMITLYHKLGVRHMLLAYNQKNAMADGCHERTDEGLSRLGRRAVAEIERCGMILDCTHTGYRSSMDAIEMSTQPVMFSHSNVKTIRDHDRNIQDDQIKAAAKTGGLVGITAVGHFLADDMQATPEAFVDHIDYIAELVGTDHIGIGIDHVYYTSHKAQQRAAAKDSYPDADKYPARGDAGSFLGPEDLIAITEVMVQRGYDDDDIEKILGGNFLRVAEQIWN
jgi:membrane dipeptidase